MKYTMPQLKDLMVKEMDKILAEADKMPLADDDKAAAQKFNEIWKAQRRNLANLRFYVERQLAMQQQAIDPNNKIGGYNHG